MNYGSIASKISGFLSEVSQTIKQMEIVPIDDIWKGSAHNSLATEFKNIINKLNVEQANITKFSGVLNLMETYKQSKEQLDKLKSDYNNAQDEKVKQELKSRIDTLESELLSFKNSILKELNYDTAIQNENTTQLGTSTNITYSTTDAERILKDAVILPEPDPIEYIDGKPEGILKKKAKQQVIYFDGKRLAEDSVLNVKLGETIRIKVVLPKDSGEVNLMTRNTASGQKGWEAYIDAYSEPHVNRHDRSTALPTDTFEWVITPTKKSREPVILSQTTFHTTDYSEEVKSMIRVKINIIDDEEFI
ncbi:MAG: hypothetical protein IJ463_05840 [Bacilli bacterium]|nr:hypothetical protein [Bacilli bacterium]